MTATASDLYSLGIRQKRQFEYAKALASFEAALAAEPKNPEFLTARGNMLYALGRYQEALETYQQAASLGGRHRGLLLAISSTLASLGRQQEAVQLFEEGMQAPRA